MGLNTKIKIPICLMRGRESKWAPLETSTCFNTALRIYDIPCLWGRTNISGFGENLLPDAPEHELKDRSGRAVRSVIYSGDFQMDRMPGTEQPQD
jgi:hypothetical protein